MDFVADFETTTDENDCRVWGWGLCSVKDLISCFGNTIDAFMYRVFGDNDITTLYFHNLKFDGEFIENWLFKNGFRHVQERIPHDKEFTSLITDMGVFYQFKICYNGRIVTINDSLKLIPLPVAKIARAYGLPQGKGEIDYSKERPVGYQINDEEREYIRRDVEIVARAIKIMKDDGHVKMTTASNALNSFKEIFGKKEFEKTFPVLECDKFTRRSYKGGFTYANPKFQGKEIGEGSVYDVNSLYPFVMYTFPMPYGMPIWFDGEYERDKMYPLYIQAISCQFKLREGFIPTVQLKNHSRFAATEYLSDSGAEEIYMIMTNVDLELFLAHYDVFNLEYLGGYKFRATDKLFKKYIDKWTEVKVRATIEKNSGMRTIAKLMLNSLYGKFGMNPRAVSKIPFWNGEMVGYRNGGEEWRKPLYVPVASFTTAYARRYTITAAQRNFERFLYADTDSLHLVGFENPEGVDIDAARLGAWKHENDFRRGKYLRAKSYVEEIVREDGKDVEPWLKVTCAGMPERCHEGVTFENFEVGFTARGKLQHKRVPGGVVLKEIEFTIKG